MNSGVLTQIGSFLGKLIGGILYFPVWWYGPGLAMVVLGVGRFWGRRQSSLGFFIWLKNIFVPMYGQRDFSGRVVSFIMRFFQVVFRGLLMFIYLVLGLAAIAVWLLLLPAWIYAAFFWL